MAGSARDRVGELLDSFPGPLALRPSPLEWLLIIVGGAVFLIGSIWMTMRHPGGAGVSGWASVIFFSLWPIVGIVSLLPGGSGLTLDANGFVHRNLFRSTSRPWSDVDGFVALGVSRTRMVAFDDRAVEGKTLARANDNLIGRNSSLPDTYGLSADDLARLLQSWRDRALSRLSRET